jgi:hypothetical protein
MQVFDLRLGLFICGRSTKELPSYGFAVTRAERLYRAGGKELARSQGNAHRLDSTAWIGSHTARVGSLAQQIASGGIDTLIQ